MTEKNSNLATSTADLTDATIEFDDADEALEKQGTFFQVLNGNKLEVQDDGSNLIVSKNTTYTIDGASGEFLKVSGIVDIDIYGIVTIEGGFALEKGSTDVVLSSGNIDEDIETTAKLDMDLASASTDYLTISMENVSAFVGYDNNTDDLADDKGVRLSSVDMSLTMFEE